MGGRYEPIGKAFEGSTITCPEGAAQVPGVAAALEQHSEKKPGEPQASLDRPAAAFQ
jgi:hypothetical protein